VLAAEDIGKTRLGPALRRSQSLQCWLKLLALAQKLLHFHQSCSTVSHDVDELHLRAPEPIQIRDAHRPCEIPADTTVWAVASVIVVRFFV